MHAMLSSREWHTVTYFTSKFDLKSCPMLMVVFTLETDNPSGRVIRLIYFPS